MGINDHVKPTVAVVVMSKIATDVRVIRHLQALEDKFQLVSVGYGPSPGYSFEHIQIPDKLPYLPLNLAALVPHALRQFRTSSQRISAVKYVAERLSQLHIDAVLLNDVATFPLISRIDVPTIVDMHEFAPLELEGDWRFNLFLRRYNTWLCHEYLPQAARVTTVSDGLAARYEKDFGVDVAVIYNAREEQQIPIRPTTTPKFRLIHTGLAAQTRRLDVMITAVSRIPYMTLDMYLVEAPYQSKTLRDLTARASSTTNVRIKLPVKSSEIPRLINEYDLSLVYVSDASFTHRHGMPNKLFDSIQARTGIVTGPSKDLSEFCLEHQIGISTSTFSANDLEMALRSLNVETVNGYKQNADHVARIVHSRSEGKKLEEIVERAITTNP